jgi:Putative peptidoglycan binding domain
MRIPYAVSRVVAGSLLSTLLFAVTTPRMQGQSLGRPVMVLNHAHFNAGIGAKLGVRTGSPIVVPAPHVDPVQIKPFANTLPFHSLYDPLDNNPLDNNPALEGQNPNPAVVEHPMLPTDNQSVLAPNRSALGTTIETKDRAAVLGYSVSEVREVQTALRRLGYYQGAIDGDFGVNTLNALESYQLSAGEPITGTLTQGVLSRLGVTARR